MFSSGAVAQISCKYDVASFAANTSAGIVLKPAPGAQVTVCATGAAGSPCSPKSNLVTPLGAVANNPVTADNNGNYGFCVGTAGKYMIQVGGTGFSTVIQDGVSFPNDPINPTFGTVTATGYIATTSYLAGNGLISAPSFAFTSDTGTGLYRIGANTMGFATGGTFTFGYTTNNISLNLGRVIGWTAGGISAPRTGISEVGAGTVAIGNGTATDQSGTITAQVFAAFSGATQTSRLDNTGVSTASNLPLAFSSTTSVTGTKDVGISRGGVGTLAVGNGTAGDTTGIMKSTQYLGIGVGGQRSAAFLAQATGSVGFAWSSSGAGADQKDWDVFADATPRIQFRTVNEANNSAIAWLTINRGAGTAVSSIVFGSGGGSQTMFTATDTFVGRSTTDTLANKRITQRVVTLGTSTTFTPDGDNSDVTFMNMTGVAGTLTIAAPTGTPTDGQKLTLRIKTTNAQTYSFNATYRFSTTVTAPTTTAAAKTDYIGLFWNNTDSKWDVVAVDQGH